MASPLGLGDLVGALVGKFYFYCYKLKSHFFSIIATPATTTKAPAAVTTTKAPAVDLIGALVGNNFV